MRPPPLLLEATTGSAWSPDTLRKYLYELDRAFDTLENAVATARGSMDRNPRRTTFEFWRFLNGWQVLFAEWKAFFANTIDDWMLTATDHARTEDFAAKLDSYRKGFKSAIGHEPPKNPLPKQQEPSTEPEPIQSSLDSATSLLKWGVLGYLAVTLVGALKK